MRRAALYFMLMIFAFPALEIYTMFAVAESIGWWLLAWLAFSALTGWLMLRGGSMAMFARMAQAMQQGYSPYAVMWDTGRTILAGMLLIFPGLISDAMALLLLLLPNRAGSSKAYRAANDDIIEGEVRVVEAEQIEIKSEIK